MLNATEIMELQKLAGMENFKKLTIPQYLEIEKLIELLCQATFGVNKQTIKSYLPPSAIAEVADHLIANGVTVQEWISVKDRLPEEHGWYLIVVNGKVEAARREPFLMFGEIWNNDATGGYSIIPEKEVTHWMPMPQPPKGE